MRRANHRGRKTLDIWPFPYVRIDDHAGKIATFCCHTYQFSAAQSTAAENLVLFVATFKTKAGAKIQKNRFCGEHHVANSPSSTAVIQRQHENAEQINALVLCGQNSRNGADGYSGLLKDEQEIAHRPGE